MSLRGAESALEEDPWQSRQGIATKMMEPNVSRDPEMSLLPPNRSRRSRTVGWLFLCLVAQFVLVHSLFGLYDAYHPTAYLNGDRAGSRAEKILQIEGATAGAPVSIYDLGPPGDYIAHALFDKIGGRGAVIGLQVLLTLGSMLMATALVLRLDGRLWPSALSGLFATWASGMLMNPHNLVTEPWSTFFLTLGCFLSVMALPGRQAFLYAGFLSFSASAFFRPSALLVPGTACLLLLLLGLPWRRIVFPTLASYIAFPLSWATIRFATRHEFGLGASDFDLDRNYWLRAARVAIRGDAFDPYIGATKMPLRPFLSVIAAHPMATAKTFLADAGNLFLNPGSNQVFGQYLHVISTPDDKWFFRNLLDREGLTAVLRHIGEMGFGFVSLFSLFFVLQAVVVVSCILAPFFIVKSENTRASALLLTVVAVSLISVFAAGGVRWSQRSNVEPVSAAIAALTLGALFDRKERKTSIATALHDFTHGEKRLQ